MVRFPFGTTDGREADVVWNRFVRSRSGRVLATLSVGVVTGCWIAYVLLYPFSSLPLPRYSLGAVVLLGWYVDYFSRSMLDRMAVLLGAAIVAYVVAFAAYTMPALLGWYADPIAKRSLYLSGFRRVLLFTLPALVLLVVGTISSYLLRNVYREITY